MKILFIAYYFPPDSSSGSFRPLFFANHLSEMGDEITVLTARQEHFLDEQPLDPSLLSRLDSRIQVVRTAVHRPHLLFLKIYKKLRRTAKTHQPPVTTAPETIKKGWLTRSREFLINLMITPDRQMGWILSCVYQGLVLTRNFKPDIIFATGGPWSALVAGNLLKKLSGVPLVIDFRDHWIEFNDPAYRGLIKKVNIRLERKVVTNADLIIANTDPLRDNFLYRYPTLSPTKIVTITNGFEDYLPDTVCLRNDVLTLTHAGSLGYASRDPTQLLEAAKVAIENGKIDARKIKFRFIGELTINNSAFAELIASPFLKHSIEIIPRVTYEEAQKAIVESNILIIFQQGFPLAIPRKIYDYMAARRPVLCISEPGDASWLIVKQYSLGKVCENNAVELETVLVSLYEEWQNNKFGLPINSQCDVFKNYNLAVRLRNLFEKIIKGSSFSKNPQSVEN